MADLDEDIKQGRAIKDMMATEGWQILEQRINQEIEDERIALKEVDKKEAFSMLVEFIDHQKTMKGLEMIFDFIKDYLADKKKAEDKLRD